jgi:hypothetical protein
MGEPAPFFAADTDKLLFRRQFVLAPRPIEGFSGWTRLRIGGEHYLAAHPDLEVHQATMGGKSITLLGYILDPDNPEHTNADIVEALLGQLETLENLIASTNCLGGRWILIASYGAETILFNDACGLRQIYYARPDLAIGQNSWCASQPGLIAESLKLEADSEALDFLNARQSAEFGVYWLPDDMSLHKEIKLLLPNHYLNLRTGVAHRFWPDMDLGNVEPREAVEESARLLLGLMTAARRRFDMALPLTAGWDSRVMLALCKNFVRDVYFYTFCYPWFTETTADIAIPAALTRRLGVQHNVIRYPEHVNVEFAAIYRRNNITMGKAGCGDAQALYEHYPQERVCVGGDAGEIVKCFFRPPGVKEGVISAQDLAKFDNFGTSPFVLRAYEKWLEGAHPRNVHLLDLFCWEHMAGRVQGSIRSQFDMVQECFPAYNCRSLLVTMLSVDERYRKPPEFEFLRDLIARLWTEILREPINPGVGARAAIAGLLRKWRIYHLIPPSFIRLGKHLIR